MTGPDGSWERWIAVRPHEGRSKVLIVEPAEQMSEQAANALLKSETAFAIADQLNIPGEDRLEILDSSELTSVDPELLAAIAKRVHVYSRVSPAHKLRIVQALQERGVWLYGTAGESEKSMML